VLFRSCASPHTCLMISRRIPLRPMALAATMVLVLASCGGSPGEPLPTGATRVTGVVTLPAGSPVAISALEVVTPYGSYPVDDGGRYTALALKGADSELAVHTTDGDLLLLGVSRGASAPISSSTTAEALLYYLVGAMWLPADEQDTVRELLRGRPEIDALTPHVARLLAAGGN